jgi:hypothetical protein
MKVKITVLFRWCAILLLCPTLLAQSTQTGSTTGTTSAPARTSRKKRATVSAADVQSLRDALAAQQQQIQQQQQILEELRTELKNRDASGQQAQQQAQQAQSSATAAQEKATAAESAANEQKDTVAKLQTDVADVKTNLVSTVQTTQDGQKRISAVESLLGRFRFTGDMRVRGESFFQDYSGCTGCFDRNRARLRARFGVEGSLNDDFQGGFFLATGSQGDPTTTNETFTNAFDRKTIAVDRGYITYNPLNHKWLSLTGGKFAYPWNRTPVTFDSDLNPEGFDEKLSFDFHGPFLQNVTVQGMQLLFNEVSKGPDSFAAGGQISSKWNIGHFWTMTPSATLLNWHNADALLQASAFAVAAPTTGSTTPPLGPFPVPGEGPGCATGSKGSGLPAFAPCAFAPNGITNATRIDSKGVPHFISQFLYADAILNNTFQTGMKRLPLNLVLEFLDNLNANGPLNVGVGKQSKAYGGDISLGQTKDKNDVQFGYAYLRQEQDSALAAFNESDQRAPTNLLQHKGYVNWKLRKNVTAGYTLWVGRTLNSNLANAALASGIKPGQVEPYLKRMQFDLIYSF